MAPTLTHQVSLRRYRKYLYQTNRNILSYINIALNPTLDTYNYTNVNNPSARKTLLQMMATFNLIDVFRHLHER